MLASYTIDPQAAADEAAAAFNAEDSVGQGSDNSISQTISHR